MTIVSLLQAIFLGGIQGLTEFLPVSSTGHLIIFEHLFNLDPQVYGLSFDMFTNLGTSLALVFYFRKDLKKIIGDFRMPKLNRPLTAEQKIPWWIIISTIIVGGVGFLLEDTIATKLRDTQIIAWMLILFGIVMLAAEKINQNLAKQELRAPSAIAIGLSQMLAFIPGVSRSGATISTGLFLGISRAEAARFSFLLSVPITLAAIAKRLFSTGANLLETGISPEVATFYLVGLFSALIVGYFSIHFLLGYLQKSSLAAFAYYRFGLAILILVLLG